MNYRLNVCGGASCGDVGDPFECAGQLLDPSLTAQVVATSGVTVDLTGGRAFSKGPYKATS